MTKPDYDVTFLWPSKRLMPISTSGRVNGNLPGFRIMVRTLVG